MSKSKAVAALVLSTKRLRALPEERVPLLPSREFVNRGQFRGQCVDQIFSLFILCFLIEVLHHFYEKGCVLHYNASDFIRPVLKRQDEKGE